jgi:polyphosphate kinase 2
MRVLDFLKFINERLEISENNLPIIKDNLVSRLIEYKNSILQYIDSDVEYDNLFDSKTAIRELTNEFTEDVVRDLNLSTFLIKVGQILELKRPDTKKLIRNEFNEYINSLDKRLIDISGDKTQYFDTEEGESSLISGSVYATEEEELQDELIKFQCWVKGGRRIKTSQANELYKSKINKWKEEQQKLGRNTSPGAGTRARFLREVEGVDTTPVYKYEEVPGAKKQRIAIVFEGRDSAGKGSSIKRFMLNAIPGVSRVVAGLGIPTPEERKNWFSRYEKQLPNPGEIVYFDRSWYNRAVVEPVNGYCTEEEYKDFMAKVLPWEESLVDSGIILIKFWFSITEEKQKERFKLRQTNPLKFWKFSPNDARVIDKYDLITNYKNQMFRETASRKCPWVVVNSNDKKVGRLNAIRFALSQFRYPEKNADILEWYPEVVTVLK